MALLRSDPAGQAPGPFAVAAGLLGVLRGLAAHAPLLVAIDDLQWLDPASAAALAFAMRRLDARQGRFLLARRPGQPTEVERALGAAGVRRARGRTAERRGNLPAAVTAHWPHRAAQDAEPAARGGARKPAARAGTRPAPGGPGTAIPRRRPARRRLPAQSFPGPGRGPGPARCRRAHVVHRETAEIRAGRDGPGPAPRTGLRRHQRAPRRRRRGRGRQCAPLRRGLRRGRSRRARRAPDAAWRRGSPGPAAGAGRGPGDGGRAGQGHGTDRAADRRLPGRRRPGASSPAASRRGDRHRARGPPGPGAGREPGGA